MQQASHPRAAERPAKGHHAEGQMPKITDRAGRAAGRKVKEVENRILAAEGRKSIRAKVATVKRVTKKALKAGAIAGALAATAVVMRERKKRQRLES